MSFIGNKPARPRTTCFDCRGVGIVGRPAQAVRRGTSVRAMIVRQCPTCQGTRWLSGLVIPT